MERVLSGALLEFICNLFCLLGLEGLWRRGLRNVNWLHTLLRSCCLFVNSKAGKFHLLCCPSIDEGTLTTVVVSGLHLTWWYSCSNK